MTDLLFNYWALSRGEHRLRFPKLPLPSRWLSHPSRIERRQSPAVALSRGVTPRQAVLDGEGWIGPTGARSDDVLELQSD